MSGVSVVWYLLKTNAPVLAALGAGPPIAAARIMAGDLPVNTVLPAMTVIQISSVPRNTLSMKDPRVQHQDRVQVTWHFKGPQGSPAGTGYPGASAMGKLVFAACPNAHGLVNNISVDSIIPDVEGPDLQDDATALYSGSRDFIIRWNSP